MNAFDDDDATADETRIHRAVRAEEGLRDEQERYRLIIEGARDYTILTTDITGVIETWSPGAAEVFGWTAEEIIGEPLSRTFLPEDRAKGAVEAELQYAQIHGVAPDVRWHLRKDGQRVFIEGVTRALRGEDGALRGFLKIGQDVTHRRNLDEALRASEARYRMLVDTIVYYAIILLD